MKISLEGKVALVTGAGAGIGKAIAEAYLEIGAKIVVAEIDEGKCAALREQFGDAALIAQVDVRDVAQVEKLRDQITERFGRLDVLVNNVGHHLRIFGPLEHSKEEEWDALYQINLKHMFIVTRAMLPLMKSSGEGGSIINLSSIEGFRGYPGNVVYTTFKHAVTGFTRGLATQLATDQIRVNVLGPETTESEQVPIASLLVPKHREAANRTIPMNRFGRPQDHAGVAVFLATDLSGWVTGSSFIVDGGGFNANAFKRTEDGVWTIIPVVTENGLGSK